MTFDSTLASRATRFINLLKHTGDYHGIPFDLLPWESSIVSDVFGTINERGLRQYRHVYIEVPKKNGKSELLSAIACYHLFNKAEANGEMYSCAGDRMQASIIYDTAVEMIMQEPALKKLVDKKQLLIRDSYKLIENTITGTSYKVLSAESFTKHGYRPSIVLFDELHVQPNRDLWDTMTKGSFLARRQPLLWVITTAGDDPDRVSIGYEIHSKAETILQARRGVNPHNDIPTWYPVIYSYQGEDIYNEKNWALANPSLGHNLQLEDIRQLAAEAKLSPADERTFRWLNLNQWITTKLTTWLPLDLFDSTIGDWSRNDLLGYDCYLGGDFSTTTDLSAIALVFPPQPGPGGDHAPLEEWRVIWECWIPRENMAERIRTDHVPYDKWAAAGWIFPTEGNQIDYDVIEARIWELSDLYNIVECGVDTSFATMLIQHLQKDAPKSDWVVDVPQQYQHMTDPMNTLEILLRQKRLTHEAHDVARWCFGNASIAKNGNAQIKLVKEHKGRSVDRTKRIDLITALVNAMARARGYSERVDLSSILDEDYGM